MAAYVWTEPPQDSDGVLHVPPRWRNDPGVAQAETLLEMDLKFGSDLKTQLNSW